MTTEPKVCRPIYSIAKDIWNTWRKPYYGAAPYMEAMLSISHITDMYGEDDAKSIVNYFLVNANTFRGEDARRLKAELKALL